MTKLEELGKLIQKVTDFQGVRDGLQKSLDEVDKRIDRLVMEDIPAMMDSLGMAKITTDDGWNIEVKETWHAKIPDEKAAEAYNWLEENGFGALIRNHVVVEYDREDYEKAAELFDELCADGLPVSMKKNIHHSRLKAFVTEQKEAGNDIPDAAFGVYHKREAKLKRKT